MVTIDDLQAASAAAELEAAAAAARARDLAAQADILASFERTAKAERTAADDAKRRAAARIEADEHGATMAREVAAFEAAALQALAHYERAQAAWQSAGASRRAAGLPAVSIHWACGKLGGELRAFAHVQRHNGTKDDAL